jgi:hypothetical protein
MKARDIFGLAVRLLGLVFLYFGLASLPMTIGQTLTAVLDLPTSFNNGAIFSRPFTGLWPFIIALWLLYGAPPLMRIAYPHGPGEKE